MPNMLVLWVNLTGKTGTPALCERLRRHCHLRVCEGADVLVTLETETRPQVICLDFAEPDPAGRTLVQRIRLEHPSVPLLLFTTSRSVDLVIWAMRTRVWDCFIKPVSCGEVMRRLNILTSALSDADEQRRRKLLLPDRTASHRDGGPQIAAPAQRTAAALPFLNENFHRKIALPDAARLCRMDAFEFSRCFHREHGMTFRDYLLRLRIEVAAHRLLADKQSILEIAYSVGFNDPSHFARLFRRHMGVTPRVYRNSATTLQPLQPVQAGLTAF